MPKRARADFPSLPDVILEIIMAPIKAVLRANYLFWRGAHSRLKYHRNASYVQVEWEGNRRESLNLNRDMWAPVLFSDLEDFSLWSRIGSRRATSYSSMDTPSIFGKWPLTRP